MEDVRESLEIDVLFVGGGPASLSAAIKLAKLCQTKGLDLEIAVIEKSAALGNHCVSGAIMNPIALSELLPEYEKLSCPISNTVQNEKLVYLTRNRAIRIPFNPKYTRDHGFPIISLSRFSQWLGLIAEEMGVMILPEYCGKEIIFGPDDKTVTGVRIGDKGLDKNHNPLPQFEPGPDILAKVTVLGEGPRGSLFGQLDKLLGLSQKRAPQIYEIGIKEVIQVPSNGGFKSGRGNVIHALGFPLGTKLAGGGFVYELDGNLISLGYLTALGYEDPGYDPYDNLLAFKHHPFIAEIIKDGEVIEQGARTVSNGGLYSVPELVFDGGMVIGACGGIQNPQQLKGIHPSMKTGMLAAEGIMVAFEKQDFSKESLSGYQQLFEKSWVRADMSQGRNFSQALAKKSVLKFFHIGAQYLTNGRGVVDGMKIDADDTTFRKVPPVADAAKNAALPTDGRLYLDKLTGVYLAKTKHREDQPNHLLIIDPEICEGQCYTLYGNPCVKFCPGQVYETEWDEAREKPVLRLNPSNCLHCKTCEIKDPFHNISWTCPEGGSGPGYINL